MCAKYYISSFFIDSQEITLCFFPHTVLNIYSNLSSILLYLLLSHTSVTESRKLLTFTCLFFGCCFFVEVNPTALLH